MTAVPDPPGGGLGPETRALLDAARDGLSPDLAAVRRVHARVHAATGGAAAAGTALGIKLGLIGLVAAAVVGGAVAYSRRGPSAVSPPVIDPTGGVAPRPTGNAGRVPTPDRASLDPTGGVAPRPAGNAGRVPTPDRASLEVAAPPEPPQRTAVHQAAPPRSSDEQLGALEPVPRAPIRRTAPRPAPKPKLAVAPAAPSPASIAPGPAPATRRAGIALGREVELIDQAMAVLRRGDPGAALRGMQDYAREAGGGGQLAEDAAAIEVEALCKLGDPAAADRRARFDARFPRSAQRSRLAAACP